MSNEITELLKDVKRAQEIANGEQPTMPFRRDNLANEHWSWVVKWLEMVFKDAFMHGYKHGVADTRIEELTLREHYQEKVNG